jgi:hypothetical protein
MSASVEPSGRALLAPEFREPTGPVTRVSVVDVNMPFGSMVSFMVKWALAAIPALLILAVVGFVLSALLAGIATGITR